MLRKWCHSQVEVLWCNTCSSIVSRECWGEDLRDHQVSWAGVNQGRERL